MDHEGMKEELTLGDIFKIFRRRIFWFLLILIVTVVITAIYLILSTPVYKAEVTIKLLSQGSSINSLLAQYANQFVPLSSGGSPETELITSRTSIEKVINKLNLMEYYKKKNPKKEITIYDLVNMVTDMVTVSPGKSSSIVKVAVENSDPKLAANIANELANAYDELMKSFSRNEYTVRREFIEQQIPQVQKELQELENKLRRFKEENKVYALDAEAGNLLNIVYKYDSQINETKIKKDEAEARIASLNQQLKQTNQKIISSETISINPVVSQLRSKLVDLQIQLSALLNTYSQNDIKVKDVQKQIDETEKMLRNEVENIVTAQVQTINPDYQRIYTQLAELHSDVEVFDSTISSIQKVREKYESQLSKLPAVEQQLLQLERGLKVKEQFYSLLLQALEEAQIAEAGVSSTVKVIDTAEIPVKPAKPNKKLSLAIGTVLGCFLGILVVFITESTDKRINDEDFVENLLDRDPVLGKVPESEFRNVSEHPELAIEHSPASGFSEAVKLLSTNIEYSNSNPPKVVALTSPEPYDGKTILAANVALSYAQNGYKTLLLNLDMRNPKIEKLFSLGNTKIGITDHILKDVSFDQIVCRYNDKLDVIPVGNIPNNPTIVLTSKRFEDFMNRIKGEYDKVIIDLPSMLINGKLPIADVIVSSKQTDGIVLVVRIGKTKKLSLKTAYENIRTSGIKFLGVVINGIRL
ncbi:MAG TPA: polysaccharide biosynthesis tyrosine autokinase [Fervidobacterium sp.]|nr:polysaccharide biosynthesis tyrosine autokinase [Fervidobacterium sp.]